MHPFLLTERPVLALQVYRFVRRALLDVRGRALRIAVLGGTDVSEWAVKVEGKRASARRFPFPLRTSRSRTGNTAQKDVPLYWHPSGAQLNKTQRSLPKAVGWVARAFLARLQAFAGGSERGGVCCSRTVTLFPVVRGSGGIISR